MKSITLNTPWNGVLTLTTQWFLGWKVTAGDPPPPALGPTVASYPDDAVAGDVVAVISGLQADETIIGIAPGDGRLIVGPDGTSLVVGSTPSTAGTVVYSLVTSSDRVLNISVTVYEASNPPDLGPVTATFDRSSAAGTIIAEITGLIPGETIQSVTPADGRVVVGPTGVDIRIGSTSSAVGSYSYTVTTTGARALSISVTVTDNSALPRPITPSNDWRLPITAASTGGDTAWSTALVASGTAKTIPLKTSTITGGSTYVVSLAHDQVAAPGGILFLDWIASGAVATVFTYEYSTDTTTGDDGTWTASPFTPYKPTGHTLATQYSTVGQIINIPVGARGSRLTIQTGANSTCRPYLAAFQLKADGSNPIFAGIGMSIEYQNQSTLAVRDEIMEDIPGSDPIFINMARAGANSSAIKTEQIDVLVAGGPNNQLSHVKAVIIANGPNDRAAAFDGGTTFPTDTDAAVVGTLFQTNIDALIAKFGAQNVYAANIAFGRYDDNVLSQNYFLPYNRDFIQPRIKSSLPTSWTMKYDAPRLDDYSGQASDFEKTLTDKLHNNSFGAVSWRSRRRPVYRDMFNLTVVREVLDDLMTQVGSGARSAYKQRIQDIFNALPSTSDSVASANRAALQSRITAIATTYQRPALTGQAKYPDDPSIASGSLFADFDMSDFGRVERYLAGQTQSVADRNSGLLFTQNNANPSVYPILTPSQSDGQKAKLHFAGPTKLSSMQSSDPSVIGFLDAANKAYTVIMVFAVGSLLSNGHDMFSIGNAATNFLIMGIGQGVTNPRILVGDGTGSAFFNSGDSGVVLGQRTVIAFRNDGTGTGGGLKYFRGSFDAAGTSTRVAAKVGTAAYMGRRTQGSSAYFHGDIGNISLHNGALSDSDILSIMAAHQQNGAA